MIKSIASLESVEVSDNPDGLKINSSQDCWLELDKQALDHFLDSLRNQIKQTGQELTDLKQDLLINPM